MRRASRFVTALSVTVLGVGLVGLDDLEDLRPVRHCPKEVIGAFALAFEPRQELVVLRIHHFDCGCHSHQYRRWPARPHAAND